MKYQKIYRNWGRVLSLSVIVLATVVGALGQKLTAQEIISKHIASIGTPDAISKAAKRMVIGSAGFLIKRSPRTGTGDAVLASNGTDMALFSTFDLQDYPMERIGIFGGKINIPRVSDGRRSPLGGFLAIYDKTMDARLFGGCIFSTWAFYDLASLKGKVETDGKKKVGDREAWVVKYSPKGGLSPLTYIKLYFDAENFHHIRTVYTQPATGEGFHDAGSGANRGSGGGTPDTEMYSSTSTITEDFEDFKDEAGLTMPHKYKIDLVTDALAGTNEYNWTFNIREYRIVNDFPAGFFNFSAAK